MSVVLQPIQCAIIITLINRCVYALTPKIWFFRSAVEDVTGLFIWSLQGPFTEEFVFRACMLPVLVPSLGENLSLLLCPLFFGFGKHPTCCQ